MTITLGALTINDDMYLDGVVQAKNISYEQKRSIEGVSAVSTKVIVGGKLLTLGTTNERGATQGIWFQKEIDALKALELQNLVLTLDYHGAVYTVKIVDTTDFKQLQQFEPVHPCKMYLGKFSMIEV